MIRISAYWPLALLGGFFLLLWLLFGERVQPRRAVDLVPVVTQRAAPSEARPSAEAGAAPGAIASVNVSGPVLFQASGWIESAPLPIHVPVLRDGIVETVEVLEGEAVREGQLLATLVDDDAALDLRTAEAAVGRAEATLRRHRAELASAGAALRTLDLEIAAAAAARDELQDESARLAAAGREVFPEREVVQARLRLTTQERRIAALEARKGELRAQLEAGEARVEDARHAVEEALVERDRRQLALDRTRITSPVDGIVQVLFVSPGMKRIIRMDGRESATVVKLYQPGALQARIDVALENAAGVFIGQPVRLRSSLLPDRVFKGEVTRIEGQADLQRNTLQAKVAVLDPDPLLRPEMLCRAEFLGASAEPGSRAADRQARVAIFAPEAALQGAGGERFVWKLDASGERAERQLVTISDERRDGFVRILEGLRPGDRVVVQPPGDLQDGERLRHEDND